LISVDFTFAFLSAGSFIGAHLSPHILVAGVALRGV